MNDLKKRFLGTTLILAGFGWYFWLVMSSDAKTPAFLFGLPMILIVIGFLIWSFSSKRKQLKFLELYGFKLDETFAAFKVDSTSTAVRSGMLIASGISAAGSSISSVNYYLMFDGPIIRIAIVNPKNQKVQDNFEISSKLVEEFKLSQQKLMGTQLYIKFSPNSFVGSDVFSETSFFMALSRNQFDTAAAVDKATKLAAENNIPISNVEPESVSS